FSRWAAGTKHAAKFAEQDEIVAKAREFEKADNSAAIERMKLRTDRISEDLRALSTRTGLPINSMELLRRASVDYPIIEGPVFHSSLAFEHINGGGAELPLVVTMPDLGWLRWSNRISSIFLIGYGMFADLTWYRGSKLHLVG